VRILSLFALLETHPRYGGFMRRDEVLKEKKELLFFYKGLEKKSTAFDK